MADYPTIRTVLDRLVDAGVAQHHAERHIRYGRVTIDGTPVQDPHTLVERDQRVVLHKPGLEVEA